MTEIKVGDTVAIKSLEEIVEACSFNEHNEFVFENVDIPMHHLDLVLTLEEVTVGYVDDDGDFKLYDQFGFCTYPNEIIDYVAKGKENEKV